MVHTDIVALVRLLDGRNGQGPSVFGRAEGEGLAIPPLETECRVRISRDPATDDGRVAVRDSLDVGRDLRLEIA